MSHRQARIVRRGFSNVLFGFLASHGGSHITVANFMYQNGINVGCSRRSPVFGLGLTVARSRLRLGHDCCVSVDVENPRAWADRWHFAVADYTRLWTVRGLTKFADGARTLPERNMAATRTFVVVALATSRPPLHEGYADFSANCRDASQLLRQPLCGHSLALRESFLGNRADTARLLPGGMPG